MKETPEEKYGRVLVEYEKRFGEPAVGSIEVGPDEHLKLMERALKTGRPMPPKRYPKGATHF